MSGIISTAAFLALWFWVVYREMITKIDTVNGAKSQLSSCFGKHMQARGSSQEQDAKSILSRSLDIYHQSVMLYNRTLMKPQNYIPAFLMGFRQMNESEDINDK